MSPDKSKAPAAATAEAPRSDKSESPDFPRAAHSGQALRVIEGEREAAEFLARLHASRADPDELALIVSMLYGATLRGFCRVLEKALGGKL